MFPHGTRPLTQQCWIKRCLCGLSAALEGFSPRQRLGWLTTCVSTSSGATTLLSHCFGSVPLWVSQPDPLPIEKQAGLGSGCENVVARATFMARPAMLGVKPAVLLTMEPRFPTALLLVRRPSSQARVLVYIRRTTHRLWLDCLLLRAELRPCDLPVPSLLQLCPGIQVLTWSLLCLPTLFHGIDLTASVLLQSFCQSLVSFQWELLHVEIWFCNLHGGRWAYIFLLCCLDLLLTTELNFGWRTSQKGLVHQTRLDGRTVQSTCEIDWEGRDWGKHQVKNRYLPCLCDLLAGWYVIFPPTHLHASALSPCHVLNIFLWAFPLREGASWFWIYKMLSSSTVSTETIFIGLLSSKNGQFVLASKCQ